MTYNPNADREYRRMNPEQICDTLIAQSKADAARIAALEAENERLRMDLRDRFAGQALVGLLSTGEDFHDEGGDGWDWHARAAYSMADAMMAARAREALEQTP